MTVLSEHDVFILVAQLGIIIFAARIFGEIAKGFGQPIIVGEVFAGIVLGPAVFGQFSPQAHQFLFPSNGPHPFILQGISWLCVLFLLLITGLEIDLRASIRQGWQSLSISSLGILFSLGGIYWATRFLPAYCFPNNIDPTHVRLFVMISLSIEAIPVIAKILFDLKILRSEVGVKIITSGVLSDIWGWTILAIVISLVSTGGVTVLTIIKPVTVIFIYLFVVMKFGNQFINQVLKWIGLKANDTKAILSLLFALALLNGAIAHLLSVHVVFGAFITGIMAGESDKITPYMRQWLEDFILAVFVPIFFVLIGMQLKLNNLEIWGPIILLLFVFLIFKIGGAFLGGILGGLGRKNAFAVACGLATQGTMGIIIGLIAHEMGIFNDEMFAIVAIICVLTVLFVGPLLRWAIRGVKRPLAKYFDREHVFLNVEGTSKKEVIATLARLMEKRNITTADQHVKQALWEREKVMSTAIGDGIALPHARLAKLKEPILCFFRLRNPVDFSSPDNKPVQLLFLELTNRDDDGMQLNLIAQVARFISSEENRQKLLSCDKEEDVEHILTFDEKA